MDYRRDRNAGLLRARKENPLVILGFAGSCALGSAYGFLQGAWPSGLVEAVWSLVAVHRWASSKEPVTKFFEVKNRGSDSEKEPLGVKRTATALDEPPFISEASHWREILSLLNSNQRDSTTHPLSEIADRKRNFPTCACAVRHPRTIKRAAFQRGSIQSVNHSI